ncbi:MAG: hypothetical protein HN726_00755 [Candidatus Magasanikbacteria bacterium]|jgi:deoxycytidylate deaminase|nr:hypothetical protein [Candidatus Magasanikbacteria bacterium]MBT4220677.1 hypothetical protein [Candidatus Magasanikbacteria bacterium]MBT4350375.1 hypothetical protein [Candidatus Magasanikbacteria bacterium]MBT4541825.1 hypothetical protein [Candidatus Magasanikbacteria bacterium]MBT6252765.1 hypothetical protein [Candidatus Magasanikbacteria bacterium]
MLDIPYPYMPEGRTILYVSMDNSFMQDAKKTAQEYSLDKNYPNASVIVKDGMIIARGANGSTYHDEHGCERRRQNIPTGQGYELCEGCHPKNHGEPSALRDAKEKGVDPTGADLYLWGHWWCCEPCWNMMIDAGINNVYLLENAHEIFVKK